jgi:hypothetical protein
MGCVLTSRRKQVEAAEFSTIAWRKLHSWNFIHKRSSCPLQSSLAGGRAGSLLSARSAGRYIQRVNIPYQSLVERVRGKDIRLPFGHYQAILQANSANSHDTRIRLEVVLHAGL